MSAWPPRAGAGRAEYLNVGLGRSELDNVPAPAQRVGFKRRTKAHAIACRKHLLRRTSQGVFAALRRGLKARSLHPCARMRTSRPVHGQHDAELVHEAQGRGRRTPSRWLNAMLLHAAVLTIEANTREPAIHSMGIRQGLAGTSC